MKKYKTYPDYDLDYHVDEGDKCLIVFATNVRIKRKSDGKWFLCLVRMNHEGSHSDKFMQQIHATIYRMIYLWEVPTDDQLESFSPYGKLAIELDEDQREEIDRLKA